MINCQVCGKEESRVRILEGYRLGRPVIRNFCFKCANLMGKKTLNKKSWFAFF